MVQSNFKINKRSSKDCLHLFLEGDFDDSSALEVLNLLREKSWNYPQVIINTDHLKKIFTFGRVFFQTKYWCLTDLNTHIVISGQYAHLIAPNGVPIQKV
jgi:hypothetical protein